MRVADSRIASRMRRVPNHADSTDPMGASSHRLADGSHDWLVREEPLLLSIHGQQLMTMRTPGRDEDLGLGFLLGEGIVQTSGNVKELLLVPGDAAADRVDELRIQLNTPLDAAVRGRLARTHEIRSSCGICGLADPDALLDDLPPLLPGAPRIAPSLIAALVEQLKQYQPLFLRTGGCHGAMVTDAHGTVHGHGEDVGRHNALDKAIGMAARNGCDLSRAVAILSGRAGYDLAIKCLRLRIPVLVSVSAPSALAFDLCHAAGATLVGFARGSDFRVYCDSGRLEGESGTTA